MTRWQTLAFLAVCGAAQALRGSAAYASAPARLSYQAPDGCPTEQGFLAAVRARGASFEDASPGRGERSLNVSIERDERGFAGSLQLQQGEQTSEPRRVHGLGCLEVSDALAVITAIALQSDPAEPAAESVGAARPAQPAAALAPAPVDAQPRPAHPLEMVLRSESVPVDAGKLVFDSVLGYTLTGGVAFGVIPHLTLPRFDFTLSRANVVSTPGDRDFLVGGVLRVRWSLLGSATYHSPGFSTRVIGLKAGIGSCSALYHDPQGLVLKACGEIAAGAMGLETRDTFGEKTQSKTLGLGTASVDLNSQYNLGKVLHLDLNLGGEMWLSKISAERPDGSQIFHSSLFNAYLLAGVGLHF